MAQLISAAAADPAAGSEVTITVPAGKYWRVLSATFTLVTDATVATRTPHIFIDDGTNVFYQTLVGDANANVLTQAASLTKDITLSRISAGAIQPASQRQLMAFPDIILGPGYRIRTVTSNLQAGDNWGQPRYSVIEYNSLDEALSSSL